METEPKCIWRLPPCPSYDVEGMESWLTDMETRGLRLSRDGFFAGFAIFEKGQPSAARYRLQPAERGRRVLDVDDGPSQGEEEMSAAMGWDYVARWGEFHIYRCGDGQARELNTDPRVQAIALDKVRSRERANLISLFFWPVLFLGSVVVCGPLLCLVEIGLGRFLLLAAAVGTSCALSLQTLSHLRRLRQKLIAGEHLDHGKDWRRRQRRHYLLSACCMALVAAVVIVGVSAWLDGRLERDMIPLSEYTGEFPFPTGVDLVKDPVAESYEEVDFLSYYNKVGRTSNPIVPCSIDLRQLGQVRLKGGGETEVALIADYHETVSPALARELEREYRRAAERSRTYSGPLALGDLGVDSAWAYQDIWPTVLLRQGCRVLRVTFHQSAGDARTTEEWAALLAESLLAEDGGPAS